MNFVRKLSYKFMTPSQRRILRKFIAPVRRSGIKRKFTILSNNCWGGLLMINLA